MYEFESKKGYYNGNQYDSQLEGQWARFFDLIHLEYRRCGNRDYFELSNGLTYRPDFYLRDIRFDFDFRQIGSYVEVKPKIPTDKQMEKMARLCQCRNENMILVIGSPIKTQIDSISDESDMSSWIINEKGVLSKNNAFIESIDQYDNPAIYVSNCRHGGIYIKNDFINEAERSGRFRFDSFGEAILNDGIDDIDNVYIDAEIPFSF